MFQAGEYKCGQCGQPKRGHWCPAKALEVQTRGIQQQLQTVETAVDLSELVATQAARLVAMTPAATDEDGAAGQAPNTGIPCPNRN